MNKIGIAIVIFAIVFFIVMEFIIPILQFKPYYRWWSDNPINEASVSNCFSITALAYYQTSAFTYWMYGLIHGVPQKFENGYAPFIFNLMTLAAGISTEGFVLPRHICYSLVPIKAPNQLYSGITEWPTTETDWKTLLNRYGADWTNGLPDERTWTSNPDNFLFQVWKIPASSPIVEGFVTNRGTDSQNNKLYPTLIKPLLGMNVAGAGAAGGWWGMLQQGGAWGNEGEAEINRAVWSSTNPLPNVSAPAKGCNVGATLSGALSSGMGGAGVGVMLGGSTGGPVGAAIGGLIGIVVGGAVSAFSNNCL
jgi:hypothetical protein